MMIQEYTYRFADLNIRVCSCYDYVHRLCTAYRIDDGEEIFTVRTGQDDIDFEREKSAREDALEGRPVRKYSDEYLEALAVYRKIAERLPYHDTFLFHGSCVAVDGAGYLFTAKSGTGKSTHTRLWREMLGDRAVMVNDDKPLIRVTEDSAYIYGTPWDGKHRLSSNICVPLKAVCVLARAAENQISRITAREAYPMLLQQSYRPMDTGALTQTLSLIDRLSQRADLWQLGCNISPEAAQTAYDAMRG